MTGRCVYSQSYDSVRQANAIGSKGLVSPYLGRMRFDLIMSQRIVLTDTQVLDGAWLGAVSPAELVESLAFLDPSAPSLTIKTREDTLADSAVAFLRQAETDLLKVFRFSSLGDDAADDVVAVLEARHDRRERAPRDLDEVEAILAEAEGVGPQARHLVHRWIAWSELVTARPGVIELERFEGKADMALALGEVLREGFNAEELVALADDQGDGRPLWELAEPIQRVADACDCSDAAVLELVGALLEGVPRTALYRRIAAADLSDFAADGLQRFVDRVLGLAFRRQHGASDFDDAKPLVLQPVGRLLRLSEGRRSDAAMLESLAEGGWSAIELPSDYLARLALLSVDDLREWSQRHQGDLRAWWGNEADGRRRLQRALRSLEADYLGRVSEARLRTLHAPAPEWRVNQVVRRYDAAGPLLKFGAQFMPMANVGLMLVEGTAAVGRPLAQRLLRGMANPAIISSDIAARRGHPGDA